MAKGIYERPGKNGDITYYIRYEYQGKDIKEKVGRRSRGFSRELAKQALKARMGDMVRGQFNLEKVRKPVPFSTLVARYREYAGTYKKGWDNERYIMGLLAQEFGDTPLAHITTWRIERWKAERRREVKPASVNRHLTVLKHMFRMAIQWGLTAENPAAPVKALAVDEGRTRFLSEEEIHSLLEACKRLTEFPWLYPLVLLALNTGMRLGELMGLTWENIDMEQRLISVLQTKGRKARIKTIAVNDLALEALTLFRAQDYGDRVMAPWGKKWIEIVFNRALKAAAIEGFTFHGLRHTFASHLVMAGVDLATVSELLGHTTISMTMRYAHLAPTHKANAVDKLAQRFQAPVAIRLAANLEQNRNIFPERKGQASDITGEKRDHSPLAGRRVGIHQSGLNQTVSLSGEKIDYVHGIPLSPGFSRNFVVDIDTAAPVVPRGYEGVSFLELAEESFAMVYRNGAVIDHLPFALGPLDEFGFTLFSSKALVCFQDLGGTFSMSDAG
jgi:integrase